MFHTIEMFGTTLATVEIAAYIPIVLILFGNQHLNNKVTFGLLFLSLLISLAAHIITYTALPSLLLFIVVCYYFKYATHPKMKLLTGIIILIFAVLLLLHLVPGFNNPIIIDKFQVSNNAPPYTKYLNLDKAILGALLLYFVIPRAKYFSMQNGCKLISFFVICTTLSICFAIHSGLISFEPKLPEILVGWIITNLLFTCFVEEAFFRGFVQQQLQNISTRASWQYVSVFVSAILFGIAHFPGGQTYTMIATLMGLSYAYTYYKTGNIYASIFVHFIFNLIHFCLFTYPYNLN